MKRNPAILWLFTLLALFTFALPFEARAQTDDRNLGDKFVKFRSNSSHFDTPDEACKDALKANAKGYAGSTEDALGRVTCKFKTKKKEKRDGKEVEIETEGTQSTVVRVLICPDGASVVDKDGKFTANARAGTCACVVGKVAVAGMCAKPSDVPAKPKPEDSKKPTCVPEDWKKNTKEFTRVEVAATASASEKSNANSANGKLLGANIRKKRTNEEGARGKGKEYSPKEVFDSDAAAHHIVFSGWEAPPQGTFAKESRDLLDSVCFDVNDADNGVLVTKDVHQNSGLHTAAAAEKVNVALTEALAVKKDAAQARDALCKIRQKILDGTFMPDYEPKKKKRKK